MKKIGKKRIILLLAAVLAILLVFFMRRVPVRTFYYQTSPACNSNLYGGGDIQSFEYRILGGSLNEFNDKKSELKSLNIAQVGCKGPGTAPVDFTKLDLYLL